MKCWLRIGVSAMVTGTATTRRSDKAMTLGAQEQQCREQTYACLVESLRRPADAAADQCGNSKEQQCRADDRSGDLRLDDLCLGVGEDEKSQHQFGDIAEADVEKTSDRSAGSLLLGCPAHRRCQLKRGWYAFSVGSAAARCGDVLGVTFRAQGKERHVVAVRDASLADRYAEAGIMRPRYSGARSLP